MDEPMAGIDATSRARLAQIVAEAKAEGTTILIVLHELGELGPLLDRELHINAGHVSYDGPPTSRMITSSTTAAATTATRQPSPAPLRSTTAS